MGQQFTSLDGADEQGVRAEVLVATGTAVIDEIKDYGTNAQIRLKNDILRHPLGGFIAKNDPIFPALQAAHDQGREISYRVEQQRKRSVDRRTPIADLRSSMEEAKKNCTWIFAGFDGQFTTEAVTNPAEDPAEGGRRRAADAPAEKVAAPSGAPSLSSEQALAGLARGREAGLPDSILDATAALALACGATPEAVMSAGVQAQSSEQRREIQRARAQEAAPFNAYNTDGRTNLGSYAVQAAVGAENFAFDQMSQHARSVADAHNALVASGEVAGPEVDPAPVDFKSAAAMAIQILDLADQIQVGTAGGGRPNRMASSHTRARSFVYDAIRSRYPIPFNADAEARQAWKDAVVSEGVARFQWAAQIAHEFVQPSGTVSEQSGEQADVATSATPDQSEAPAAQEQGSQNPAPQDQGAVHPEVASQAEQAEQAEVRTIGAGSTERPRAKVEGDEGFVAPSQETLRSFAELAEAAGFAPSPDSPVAGYLASKFGVSTARKINSSDLTLMLDWYRAKGADAAQTFRDHVLREVGLAQVG